MYQFKGGGHAKIIADFWTNISLGSIKTENIILKF